MALRRVLNAMNVLFECMVRETKQDERTRKIVLDFALMNLPLGLTDI
jgi:hypothetical protein